LATLYSFLSLKPAVNGQAWPDLAEDEALRLNCGHYALARIEKPKRICKREFARIPFDRARVC
jgi:hypothetical protein